MKTNYIKLFFAAAAMCVLAACGGSDVDPRDSFVGEYVYSSTGSAEIAVGPLKYTIPLDQTGTFTIIKEGEEDQVALVSQIDTIHATVSGKNMLLELSALNTQTSGIDVRLTFDNNKATLAGTILTWTSGVNAYATYSGIAATGNGSVTVTATKK